MDDEIINNNKFTEKQVGLSGNLINLGFYEFQDINKRAVALIKVAWEIFSRKVGSELLFINKEASMQLQYAYILKQILPLIVFHKNEEIDLELETSVNDGANTREVDIMLIIKNGDDVYRIALELKCYRTKASSGKKRGATNIFMKDVYQDLHFLERYCENEQVDIGIALVMNDYKNFIYPKIKVAKCWDYDISQGIRTGKIHLKTSIVGKITNIKLNNEYEFKWNNFGNFYFTLTIPR